MSLQITAPGDSRDRCPDIPAAASGAARRESIRLQLSIPEIIRACDKGTKPWESLAHLQFFISESNYSHGTSLQFDIDAVRLSRFKDPMISELDAPNIIMLPRPSLLIPFKLMGTSRVEEESHRLVVLDTSKLTSGVYRLETEIATNGGPTCYESSSRITAVDGPTVEGAARTE